MFVYPHKIKATFTMLQFKKKKKLLFSSLPPYQTAIAGHVWHERVMLEEPSSSSHVLSAACPSSSAVRPPADPRRRM